MNRTQFITAIFTLVFLPGILLASGNAKNSIVADDKVTTTKNVQVATITVDAAKSKKISNHFFGIFFEDLNYAADGGLYAELIQNRSFEYNPNDRKSWNPLTAWEYTTQGYGYGTISIETKQPVHKNNPHYIVLNVEEVGQEGIGLTNSGFDGIVIRKGEKYKFSTFIRQISELSIPFEVKLIDKKGLVYGEAQFTCNSKGWKKQTATMTATKSSDSCKLVILAKSKGKFAFDVVSLFPENTFKSRSNGLRTDLAQTIADIKPKYYRHIRSQSFG